MSDCISLPGKMSYVGGKLTERVDLPKIRDRLVVRHALCVECNHIFTFRNRVRVLRPIPYRFVCKGCRGSSRPLDFHGESHSREYRVYNGMISRCDNEKDDHYKDYGGRGISICDYWRAAFLNFLNDMGRSPSPEHSINRIDNDGNYEPGNCEWATVTSQNRNKRNTYWITLYAETRCLAEWCELFDLPYSRTYHRLRRGWDIETAFFEPCMASEGRLPVVFEKPQS